MATGVWRWLQAPGPSGRLVLTFCLSPLLLISLASGKLVIYLQPLLPASALAACHAWQQWQMLGRTPLPARLGTALIGLLLLAGLSWAVLRLQAAPIAGWLLAPLLFLLVLAGVAMPELRRWSQLQIACAICLSLALWLGLAPLAASQYSARHAGEILRDATSSGATLAIVDTTRGILNYYAGTGPMVELDRDNAAAWWRNHRRAVLAIKRRDLGFILDSPAALARCEFHRQFELEGKAYDVLARCW